MYHLTFPFQPMSNYCGSKGLTANFNVDKTYYNQGKLYENFSECKLTELLSAHFERALNGSHAPNPASDTPWRPSHQQIRSTVMKRLIPSWVVPKSPHGNFCPVHIAQHKPMDGNSIQ